MSATLKPRVPDGACDCHIHIIDPRFDKAPGLEPAPRGRTVRDYIALQRRLGITRTVIVQAKRYGTDNACVIDAISHFGGSARGIAVVDSDISDAALRDLDAKGIRGLRFSVWNPADAVASIDTIEDLSRRINDLGWHVQLHMSGDQIVDHATLLARLPSPVVIDHLARLPPAEGIHHPARRIICDLLERGRCWMKLSGAYLNTQVGPPNFADAGEVAKTFARVAPDRMVWGSDWPHVTETIQPNAGALLDLLTDWIPDCATRARVLVDNPASLYGFT